MRKLLESFHAYHISILILIMFVVLMFISTNVWANGDPYGCDCPAVTCPDVNVTCVCPQLPAPMVMAVEEPTEKKVQYLKFNQYCDIVNSLKLKTY